jgi:RHS repeat-associated protein
VEAINCCGVVDYVHDAAGNMVGGSATAGPGTSTQYIYFRGGLLAQYWNGDGARFAHINGLGSTQQFTDWTGASAKDTLFYPWGQPGPTGSGAYLGEMWAGFNEGNFWATSEWQTDTRRYTPGLGRWYTPDPAGKGAVHPDDPQTWNMYAYVRNNPTTLTDPSGQCDWCQRVFDWKAVPGLFMSVAELAGVIQQGVLQIQPKHLVLVVTSNGQRDSALVPGVKQREIVYTIETKKGGKFEEDTSGKHNVGLDEEQTGGTDRPSLENKNHTFVGEYDDTIRVSNDKVWFNVTQTWYIDGKQATIYGPSSKDVVSGTHAYVQATPSNVDVSYGP